MAAKTRRTYAGAAASTTITAGINSTDSTITLTAATGWAAGPFYAVIDPGTASEEKVYVSSRSTTTLTIGTRGVDGTTAKSHTAGAIIYPVHTAIDSDEANELTSTYTTRGDIVYQGASTFTRLGVGSADQVLKTNGTDPSWGQVATGGITDGAVTAAKIASAVAGNGLAGGAGTALSVNVDDSTIEINSDSLRVKDSGISTAKLADDSVTSTKIAAPTLTSKTDSFTLALVDENCTMQCNKSTGMTVTVPTSSVAFSNGAVITLMQYGAGQVTVAGDTGVTIRSSNGLKLRTQYSMATLVKISNTEWVLSGDTVA